MLSEYSSRGAMMRLWVRVGLAAALSLGVACGPALAAKPTIPPPLTAVSAPQGAKARSVEFVTYNFAQPPGQRMGSIVISPLCVSSSPLYLSDWATQVSKTAFGETFEREMRAAGFTVPGQAGNLFAGGERTGSGELQVAANIKSAKSDLCAPLYSLEALKGWVALDVEWQVYSPLKREVVARISVKGVFERKETGPPGGIMVSAFGEAVKGLINDKTFRDLALSSAPDVTAGPGAAPDIAAPVGGALAASAVGPRTPLVLGVPERKPGDLSEVVGSVVTVVAGGGHGSGFLISADGYLLTNEHVVVGSKTVKIRWSDNFETVGEVLRTDRGRDVALIKTDSRGRLPLALRRRAPDLGQEVFAVGAPVDIGLSGTVTRGIVSTTNRIFNGYSYIQSDVQVTHGNSGGPLVTKEGEVVGLTDLGVAPDGVPTAVNLFIPAGDAMDFLALK